MKLILAPLAVATSIGLGWLVYQDSVDAVRNQQTSAPGKTPFAVEVTRPQTRTVQDRIELVGSLEPVAQVEVRSRIRGYIRSLPCDVGETVDEGDLLVQLDDSQHRELFAKAEAALHVAEAEQKAQQARRELAAKKLARHLELTKSGVSTPQQLEEVQSALEIARVEEELRHAEVVRAESEKRQRQLALDEASITAPLSGVVAERFAEAGDLADPAAALLRIIDLSTVKTLVHVIEKDYQRVRNDQRATIEVDAYPDKQFIGTVVRKAPSLDHETRTAAVQIEIPNADERLKPGMYARVSIVVERKPATTTIPVAALNEHRNRPCVFIVDGEPATIRRHNVTPGVVDGDFVEVSGLEPDDRIVTLGSRMVREGQVVTAVDVSQPD